jgi:hypothetical protein
MGEGWGEGDKIFLLRWVHGPQTILRRTLFSYSYSWRRKRLRSSGNTFGFSHFDDGWPFVEERKNEGKRAKGN